MGIDRQLCQLPRGPQLDCKSNGLKSQKYLHGSQTYFICSLIDVNQIRYSYLLLGISCVRIYHRIYHRKTGFHPENLNTPLSSYSVIAQVYFFEQLQQKGGIYLNQLLMQCFQWDFRQIVVSVKMSILFSYSNLMHNIQGL